MASASGSFCVRCLNNVNKVKVTLIPNFRQKTNTNNFTAFPSQLRQLSTLNFSQNVQTRNKSSMLKNVVVNDESSVKDLIYSLEPAERSLLFAEMQKFEQKRQESEGKGPDVPPNVTQLRILAVHNMLPFIGFGFLDNLIMILAGDYIDMTLGMTLGISTMAAAGLGNLVSDVCAIGSASFVERAAMKCGVPSPDLTPYQWDMTSTRWIGNLAKAFGVGLGCFIGMFPLLFKNNDKDSKSESESKSES